MVGIRWGNLSGRNRGGTCKGGEAGKCEKSEADDSGNVEGGDQCVKKRFLLQMRCPESPVVDDILIEFKGDPRLCRNTKQGEGMKKKIDAYEATGKHDYAVASGVPAKTDACEHSLDISAIRTQTKAGLDSPSVRRKKFGACEEGIGAEWKRIGEDGTAKCRGDSAVKGVCVSEGVEDLKQCASDDERMAELTQSKCKEDTKQRAQGNARVKQVILAMERGGNMVCMGLNTPVKDPVKEKKDIDSPAKCIDKDGDATKAGYGICVASMGGGSDSESGQVVRSDARIVEVDQKDVYISADLESAIVPHDFICGISRKLMVDPVVIASGQTFERMHIQAWLDAGNTVCPVTHQPLSHLDLIPNLAVKALISTWRPRCRDSGLESVDRRSSSASCVSSSLSCPTLPSPYLFSSRLLEEVETSSCFSSSSLSLPKLRPVAETHSFSSDTSSVPSYITPEHLRAARVHNFPSTPSSAGSPSASWEQSQDETGMTKHCRPTDSTQQSEKACAYLVSRIESLVSDLENKFLDIQRSAAAELRLLAKHDDGNRLIIASTGGLRPLVALVRSRDRSIQQEATTALLNLSLNQPVRDAMVKEGAIEALVGALRDGSGAAARENAAVALARLAHSDQNKIKIGLEGAVKPLVSLLERGSPRGKKDAATALYRLSSVNENKGRIVRAGASRALVGFMCDAQDEDGMRDKAIAVLGNLVGIEEGRVAFVGEKGVWSLMRVLRTGSERSKGLAVSILFQLCTHSSKHRSLVLQTQPFYTLRELSARGSMRLKEQVEEVIRVLIEDAR